MRIIDTFISTEVIDYIPEKNVLIRMGFDGDKDVIEYCISKNKHVYIQTNNIDILEGITFLQHGAYTYSKTGTDIDNSVVQYMINLLPMKLHIDSLTSKEKEIKYLIEHRLTNQEISDELNITIKTVKKHLTSIFDKLDITRNQLILNKIKEKQYGY